MTYDADTSAWPCSDCGMRGCPGPPACPAMPPDPLPGAMVALGGGHTLASVPDTTTPYATDGGGWSTLALDAYLDGALGDARADPPAADPGHRGRCVDGPWCRGECGG